MEVRQTMSETLTRLSEDLADAVAKADPYLVRVEARNRLPASGVVWSRDGVIVTAHHVIERDENIKVGLADGRTAAATLVGRDPSTDLAVLRADADGLPEPSWAEPDNVRVGHLVLALGRPGGGVLATHGIVSALGKGWRTRGGGAIDSYLQTDVVMYPGFSGGPLIDSDGRVLGLNTSALMRGVPLVVPAPTIKRVAETLLSHGRIRRGYLGVGAQPVRLPEGLAGETGQETGLLLVSVEPGSPAESAGLLLGDTVVSVDSQPMRQVDDLLSFLTGDRVGATVGVRLVRGGSLEKISVTVGERQ
jgi:S1-C subfamily serine protease